MSANPKNSPKNAPLIIRELTIKEIKLQEEFLKALKKRESQK